MKIAIIGWGSLIRCPGCLTLASKWHCGGPKLRLELSRKSRGERLTLVIDGQSDPQPTFWAMSGCDSLKDALEELRNREDCSKEYADRIHSVDNQGNFSGHRSVPGVEGTVRKWLKARSDVDAAIWTGLGQKWPDDLEKRFGKFSEPAVTAYLEDLHKRGIHHSAELYFRHAPPDIDTPIRKAIERKFGWTRELLPESLVEEDTTQPQAGAEE